MMAIFMGLHPEQEVESENDFRRLGEDLNFYLNNMNYLNSLNLGNRVENLEVDDRTLYPYIKLIECLKINFETKLNSEAMGIMRKEVQGIRFKDTKFKNRGGVADFNSLMIYLIPRYRELIADYHETLYSIYSLVM